MNKKNYLISAICGFVCIAILIVVWIVYYASLNGLAANEETNPGLGLALITIFFAIPLTIADVIFALATAGLSIGALRLMNKDKADKKLLKALSVFEFLTAATAAIFCVCIINFAGIAVMFALAFIACTACGIASIIFARKLKVV